MEFPAVLRERKISPKFFRPKFFHGCPCGMSVPKCLFFEDLEGLTEVFGRMCAGISGQKLPLWADFLFLSTGGISDFGSAHGLGDPELIFENHRFGATKRFNPCLRRSYLG